MLYWKKQFEGILVVAAIFGVLGILAGYPYLLVSVALIANLAAAIWNGLVSMGEPEPEPKKFYRFSAAGYFIAATQAVGLLIDWNWPGRDWLIVNLIVLSTFGGWAKKTAWHKTSDYKNSML